MSFCDEYQGRISETFYTSVLRKNPNFVDLKTIDMRRRCGDEEDDAAIVRGATSRSSGELSRLWRLETHHQEALTGTTATWGWEAAAENTVSKHGKISV